MTLLLHYPSACLFEKKVIIYYLSAKTDRSMKLSYFMAESEILKLSQKNASINHKPFNFSLKYETFVLLIHYHLSAFLSVYLLGVYHHSDE